MTHDDDEHAADIAREALDRADAAAFTTAGFEVIGTGGGCTAWARKLSDGHWLMVTDTGGTGHLRDAEGFLVGEHDGEGSELECHNAADLAEALNLVQRLARERDSA